MSPENARELSGSRRNESNVPSRVDQARLIPDCSISDDRGARPSQGKLQSCRLSTGTSPVLGMRPPLPNFGNLQRLAWQASVPLDHRNPLKGVSVRPTQLTPKSENYVPVEQGPGEDLHLPCRSYREFER